MTVTRTARFGTLAGIVAGLLAGHPASAGQTVIFSGAAPQAAELARILWPSKGGAQAPMGLTRSIRLNAEPAPVPPAPVAPVPVASLLAPPAAPPAPARVQVAAAQPAVASDAAPPAAEPAGGADAFGFPIRFAFDSTEVLPESRPYLDSVGQMLRLPQAQGKRVLIVGHTDATGAEEYNQNLSERRAAAVRAYLAGRFGIPADLLEVRGVGKREPLLGTDPYAPQNRRVEFHAAG